MKKLQKIGFHPEAPVLKYHQKYSNSCCLSNLESVFRSIADNSAANILDGCIKESLTLLQIDSVTELIFLMIL